MLNMIRGTIKSTFIQEVGLEEKCDLNFSGEGGPKF